MLTRARRPADAACGSAPSVRLRSDGNDGRVLAALCCDDTDFATPCAFDPQHGPEQGEGELARSWRALAAAFTRERRSAEFLVRGEAATVRAVRQAIIESPNGRESLEITVVEDVGYDERWTVRLETADVTARHGFWAGSGAGSGSLVGWCESLAADWRGWNGQREWEAVEHDFKLAASHDGLGHVVLWATLGTVVASPTNTWLVRVPLTLEAGQLDDLVARVRQLV